jgi:hypothetical protein
MSKQTDSDDADMPMFHHERARQCEQERERSRLTPADGGALDDAAKWLLMATEELDELDGLLSGGSGRRQKELLTSISYALFEAHAAVTLVGDPDFYAEMFGRPARGDADVVQLSEVRRRRDGDRPDDAA